MSKKQVVEIGLRASDQASPVFQKVAKEAGSLKAKLEALSGAGSLKLSAADVQGAMLSQAGRNLAKMNAAMRANTEQLVKGWVAEAYGGASSKLSSVTGTGSLNALMQSAGYRGTGEMARALSSSPVRDYGQNSVASMLEGFAKLGVEIKASDKVLEGFGVRMRDIARENAFRNLKEQAGLSTLELVKLRAGLGDTKGAFRSLKEGVASHGVAIAAWGTAIGLAGKAAFDASVRTDRLNKAYTTIMGSSAGARVQLEFLRETSRELGLEFYTTAEASKNFFAAVKGTNIEKDANRIFEGVAKAATALSLSETDMEGTFRALGQMVSKGKVQAEELRGQLGERLPGAFQLAARAMGMTTMELDKALELGKVMAEDMLPKLAVVLEEEFGAAAIQAADGLQQSMNRVTTEWERFKASVLDSDTVVATLKGVSSALGTYNDFTEKARLRTWAREEMEALGLEKKGRTEKANLSWDPWHKSPAALVEEFFTDAQIDEYIASNLGIKAFNEGMKRVVTDQEKAWDKAMLSMRHALRDSPTSRKAALALEQKNELAPLQDALKFFKKDSQEYADILAGIAEVKAWHTQERAKLEDQLKDKSADKQAKAEAKEYKQETRDLDVVADAMRELEEKSGQYGLSIEYTNQLIARQGELWLKAGVPQGYVDQLMEIRRLEASREGWAGAMLATQEYYTEATNMAEAYKGVVTNAFSGMEDAIVNACMTGKLSFSDMVNSMIADLMRLMVRQSITGPLASALGQGIGSLFGTGGSGGSFYQMGSSAGSWGGNFNFGSGLALTPVNVGHHGWELVGSSRPSDGTRLVPSALFDGAPRFHGGTGYVKPGEYPAILKAGERVLNPAETRAYQSRREPVVNVNIVNSTGQQASTRTRSDNHGNKTIDVYVGDMAAKQMATPGSTLNRAVSAQTGTRRPAIRR